MKKIEIAVLFAGDVFIYLQPEKERSRVKILVCRKHDEQLQAVPAALMDIATELWAGLQKSETDLLFQSLIYTVSAAKLVLETRERGRFELNNWET